ncbi:MAG: ribosome biogenesis GTP-binding protein YihA/YsxC [Alphaproteobacteria bacterium]
MSDLVLDALDAETRDALDDAALERGRLLFAQETNFVMGAVSMNAMPPQGLPEIAFAGRSNVGKSSLVNALTGRKTLARTSNTPGRTQELNFFDLAGSAYLVDLPGYGYARTERTKVRQWEGLTRDYLRGRATLRRVMVLVDSRHGLKDSDRAIMSMLDETAVSYQIVLTKTDKPKAAELPKVIQRTLTEARKHVAAHPSVAVTSSVKGLGVAELRAQLAALTA